MKSKKKDLPAMPFYIGDWKKDPIVEMMSHEDKGIYLEILMLMWESDKRGYLLINGSEINENTLAKMLHLDNQKLSGWLTTYQTTFHIFGCDDDGILYSRKHIKIIELAEKRKNAGKQGGNPKLLNQKLSGNTNNGKPNAENETENVNEDENNNLEESEEPLLEDGGGLTEYEKPTLGQVKLTFASRGYPEEDAENFWGHYDALGWEIKEQPIKYWTSLIIKWMNRSKQFGNQNGQRNKGNSTKSSNSIVTPDKVKSGLKNLFEGRT